MKKLLARFLAICLLLAPLSAHAAGLAPRWVNIGSSEPSTSTVYTAHVTTATTASIGSIKFELCTAATGACTTPTGVVTTSATLTAQTPPGGFVVVNMTNGAPYLTRVPGVINAGQAMSFALSNITNPNTANQTYYMRVTTYTGSDGSTGPVDTGAVALSTAQPVQLTGVTPEILVFCVGTTIGGDCTTVNGNSIDLGDFSPTATRSGTSVMQAQTNAANGYIVTVNGTTLASGVNTIPALTSNQPSTLGASQFGMNLKANATPAVGANPTGSGSGIAATNYDTSNLYRFVSGEAVAEAVAPTNATTFTSSYIVNIGGVQAAGLYTATMTYICTASF